MVFNVCYRFLSNYDDANDCAQETFVKVFRNLDKFKFESAFSTWLYRIAVNTCKSRMASLQYRIEKISVPIDKQRETQNGNFPFEIKDETYSPENLVEKKEVKLMVHKAIDSLPEKQRMLIILRDLECLPYDEIVKITGFKLGTVKSKIARARQALVQKIKEVI